MADICELCHHDLKKGKCSWCFGIDGDESVIIDMHIAEKQALREKLQAARDALSDAKITFVEILWDCDASTISEQASIRMDKAIAEIDKE